MDQTKVHEYLIKKPLVQVTKPFAQEVDVYKVNHKMFATLAIGNGVKLMMKVKRFGG